MKLVGLMLVRNEDWILEHALRVAQTWCDEIVALNHCSTDRTAEILSNASKFFPIHVINNDDEGWPEAKHRNITLQCGREIGGTHFAILDADLCVTRNLSLRDEFKKLVPGQILFAPLIPAWRSIEHRRVDNCVWTRSQMTLGWHDNASVGKWEEGICGYQHHLGLPTMPKKARATGMRMRNGGVIHYQFADWNRLVWKHRWYKLHEAVTYQWKPIDMIDAQYSQALDETRLRLDEIPRAWRWPDENIEVGRTPWYEAACMALLDVAKRFGRLEGLNLWGLT